MTTESSDNYLTVDASPCEPRDKNIEETSQNVQKESETSEIPEPQASSAYKMNSKKKSKSKSKKINNQGNYKYFISTNCFILNMHLDEKSSSVTSIK